MTDKQKQQLAKLYSQIATPAEKEELRNLLKMKGWKTDSDQIVGNLSTNLQTKVTEVEQAVKDVKKEVRQNTQNMSASIVDAFEKLAETIKQLGGAITTSYEKNKAKDASGFFKDINTQLAQIGGSSKQTADLITNLRWNSSMGVRDSNGSPVNPSIAPFNITQSHDYIALTYSGNNITIVTYKQGGASGNTVATLTLAYSGSNITSVTRT